MNDAPAIPARSVDLRNGSLRGPALSARGPSWPPRSRPVPGSVATRVSAAKWNTRQESNLRALGSKPNGDAGNPRLVYWIRRQESDLRGCGSEPQWDTGNPHLSNWQVAYESNAPSKALETSHLPEGDP